MIVVRDVEFLKSATKISQSPDYNLVEFAILGRSNVGKSSTINSLVNRRDMAKSSNTPGKTKLINFFHVWLKDNSSNINNIDYREFVLVDLPGIGYASVSKSQHQDWEKGLVDFIEKRENIKYFIYLIDSRHPDLELDNGVIEYLNSLNREIIILYTKTDKLSNRELSNLKNNKSDKNKNIFFISNEKKHGIDEVRNYIFNKIPKIDTSIEIIKNINL